MPIFEQYGATTSMTIKYASNMKPTLSSQFDPRKYQRRLSQMSSQDLNIQKRYWEDLIYRYKVWNQPEKQKESQDAPEMVIREMDKRLEQVLS